MDLPNFLWNKNQILFNFSVTDSILKSRFMISPVKSCGAVNI